MKKIIKAVFIDLDGTLLKGVSPEKISKKNIKYLKKLQQEEIYVVISTGRLRKEALRSYDVIKHNEYGNYMIHSGGSVTEDISNNSCIFKGEIVKESIIEIIEYLDEYKVGVKLDTSKKIWTKEENVKKFFLISKIINSPIVNIEKINISPKHIKVGILCLSRDETSSLRDKLTKKFTNLEFHISGKGFYIEGTQKGFNKGTAAKKLASELDIDLKHSAAIGDSMNDYELFKVVGHPISMKNGNKQLKKISKYITANNKNSGVAKVEKYLKWLK